MNLVRHFYYRIMCLKHTTVGPLSRTTQFSQYQEGKTNLDFTEAGDSEWKWHQLGHMQVCTSLQTDNHTSTALLSFLQAGCPSCRPTNSVKALKINQNVLSSDRTTYCNIYLYQYFILRITWQSALNAAVTVNNGICGKTRMSTKCVNFITSGQQMSNSEQAALLFDSRKYSNLVKIHNTEVAYTNN